ncbi:hypothetical protein LTR67_009722 [Exophiala xenobiotica]
MPLMTSSLEIQNKLAIQHSSYTYLVSTRTDHNIADTITKKRMLTLISATPSPFARMNRIALAEKGIPFELKNEIPWHDTTETPNYNPLEKLPILLFDDGRAPIYDSAHIQEYIVQKYADRPPTLLTGDLDIDLKAKQILTLSEGLMDAFVLVFWENRRDEDKQSKQWADRQNRKVDGAMKAMNELAKERGSSDYLLGDVLTIADIAVVCAVGMVEFAGLRPQWKEKLPELASYVANLEARKTFEETRPVMFDLKDGLV